MNCQEALSLLYDIIDQEASEIDHEQVEEHLKNCSNCSDIFRIEESWQKFLSERLDKNVADESPALRRLRGRVCEELDRQDGGAAPSARSGVTGLTFRTLAAVAAVVLIFAATYVGAGFYEHYRDYYHLELAHHQSVDQLDRFADPENTQSAIAFVEDSMNINVLTTVDSYQMVGGIITKVNDVRLSHFIYRDVLATVSLFVCRSCDMAVPESTVADDRGYHIHQCSGCKLCYGACGKARLVAAESSGKVDLGRFLEGHQEILDGTF